MSECYIAQNNQHTLHANGWYGDLQLDARKAVKSMQDQAPPVTDVGPAFFTSSQVELV